MASDPGGSTDSASERAGVDRRQFLAASTVVGGSFLAGAGTTALLADCISLTGGAAGGDGTDPLRIGGIYPQSPNVRAVGRGTVPAVELAVEAVKDAGGIAGRDVELRFLNPGRDPVGEIREFVKTFGPDVVLGLSSEAVALAAGPVIESLGVPLILTDVGTAYLTEYESETYGNYYYANETGKAAAKPNVFRTNANTSINTYAMARFAAENLVANRVANLGPDSVYGRHAWAYFKAYAGGLGSAYEFVASEFVSSEGDGPDMTAGIDAVLAADPDLVFTSFRGGNAVSFVRAAVERGLFDRVDDVFDTLGADPRVFEALGETMPEGVHYSTWYWPTAFDNPHNSRLLDAWNATYRYAYRVAAESNVVDLPPYGAASTWTAVFLYKQAVEAAEETDPTAVIPQLEGATFEEDPRGPVTIDPASHQATAPAVIGTTGRGADVPYDGVGLDSTETYTLDRSTALELLDGSGLGPGV